MMAKFLTTHLFRNCPHQDFKLRPNSLLVIAVRVLGEHDNRVPPRFCCRHAPFHRDLRVLDQGSIQLLVICIDKAW